MLLANNILIARELGPFAMTMFVAVVVVTLNVKGCELVTAESVVPILWFVFAKAICPKDALEVVQ